MSFRFEGIFSAVWTPTDAAGALLPEALKRNLAFMADRGVHGFFVLGSTGEFIHLSTELRKEVLVTIIQARPSVPTVVNVSHTNPRVVADLGKHARTTGAAGIALLPPWYFPINEDDLIEFFVRAAEAAQLPIVLYNFEERTGKRLTPNLVRAVAKRVKVGGLKQSGGAMSDHTVFAEIGREFGFNVLTGADTSIPDAMAAGAKGCIGGLGNVIPELLVEIYNGVTSGKNVSESVARVREVGAIVDTLEFPNNIAAAMAARVLEPGAPKTILSPSSQKKYEAIRDRLVAFFK
jgi:4-hydroxy-tetrahydrodipicolinate synthase